MNCLLNQYNIMTPIFWLNLILLVMLHLGLQNYKTVHCVGSGTEWMSPLANPRINTQILQLFDPIGWKSSCPGTGLIADVDRLFVLGAGIKLLTSKSPWTPYMKIQERRLGIQWKAVCTIYPDTCTEDNSTKCGCEQRDEDRYDFHLNVTVTLEMREASYRLYYLDSYSRVTTSEAQKIPPVWDREHDFVNTANKTQALGSGNCELPFEPNTPFSYCINAIEKPFLVRVISWNISPSNIVLTERISQHCVNTSGFSESGGILAYTELTGCQRRQSRYCSVKEKGSANLTLRNQALDLSEEFCTFNLREDLNVSMTVCVLKTQTPYNVTIVLGDGEMELKNFSQDCVSLYHTPSTPTFQPNCTRIFIDRCENNVTLICKAILYDEEPPERADDDEPPERADDDEPPGRADRADRQEPSEETGTGGGEPYFAVIISSIVITALLLVMCLKPFLSKKWQETEDAVVENDEGDAPELKFFDETTQMSEHGYSSTGSSVDSVTTGSTSSA